MASEGNKLEFGKVLATLESHSIKMDHFSQEIKAMNENLAVNNFHLQEHMRATRSLEARTEMIRKETEDRLRPIESHVNFINRLGKILIPMLAVPTSLYYILLLILYNI